MFYAVRPDGTIRGHSARFAWGEPGWRGQDVDRIGHRERVTQIAYAAGWQQILPPTSGNTPIIVTDVMRAADPALDAESASWAADLAETGERASWAPDCLFAACPHATAVAARTATGSCVTHIDEWGAAASTGRQQLSTAP